MLQTYIGKGLKKIKKITGLDVIYYPENEIQNRLEHYQIKKLAILIDGNTNLSIVQKLKIEKITGFFSFDLDLIGTIIQGVTVQGLLPKKPIPAEGWLVSCTNELSAFSLNKYLYDEKREGQFVLHHVKYPQATKYYSYVDFFKNQTTTLIHINNYYQRCYRIPFPLDLKLTLRNSEGQLIETRQIIVPPNHIRIIRSSDFKVENFVGYLEVEYEIPKKTMPFLHYMVDYISKSYLASNHQSGLGLHPAHTEFNRGYVPTRKKETLVVCLFQKNYSQPIHIKAQLIYYQNKKMFTCEKSFKPLSQNQMLYQDVKTLFNEIDFTKVDSPLLVVKSDVPIHRPNYYYLNLDKNEYYDVSHAARDPSKENTDAHQLKLEKEETNKMAQLGCMPMDLRLFIFSKQFQIDTAFALGNDSSYPINTFTFCFYDQKGTLIKTVDLEIDFNKERFFYFSKLLENLQLKDFFGTVSIQAQKNNAGVPLQINAIAAYQHRASQYLTSTAASGGQPDNIPFYFRGGPPSYLLEESPAGITEIFSRAHASKEFDTFFAINYASADQTLKKMIRYELNLVNALGEKTVFYRTLNVQGSDFFKLSELIGIENSTQEAFYTLWVICNEAHLYGKHFLYRKTDSALAVEHFYVGKYGL